jgi:hypothetical protein
MTPTQVRREVQPVRSGKPKGPQPTGVVRTPVKIVLAPQQFRSLEEHRRARDAGADRKP